MKHLADPGPLLSRLSEDIVNNAGFIFRLGDNSFDIYVNDDITAAVAVQKNSDHCMFWGNWHDIEIPHDILPEDGIFVSACNPQIIDILKSHFRIDGEWPCWNYMAPDGYGPGKWDELRPLEMDDVPFVAEHWELGGDDREEHIRDRVERFDSACIRENGRPVAWCGLHFEIGEIANLGFAHTLEEHRRKGYAGLVTKNLVNRLSARNVRAISDVIKDNSASMALCASLGFEIIGEQTWAYFKYE